MAKSRKEIAAGIAAEMRTVSESNVREIIAKFLEVIAREMARGEKVSLQGFGAFEAPLKPEQKKYNPLVKREIVTPARRLAKFVPAKSLKVFLQESVR